MAYSMQRKKSHLIVTKFKRISLGDLHPVTMRMRVPDQDGLTRRKHIENMADKPRKIFQTPRILS